MPYFTLAVSAALPERCAMLTDRARIADPAVMPVPGPATVLWRSPDGRAAVLRWGVGGEAGRPGAVTGAVGPGATTASHAGTIWTGDPTPGSGRTPVCARTSVTRVDPVYVVRVPGAVIVADRATWAAWTAGRLDDPDPLHVCALLNPGFPLGTATPFAGVSALSAATTLHVLNGELTSIPEPAGTGVPRLAAYPELAWREAAGSGLAGLGLAGPEPAAHGPAAGSPDHPSDTFPGRTLSDAARAVAEALVATVAPLRDTGETVELSLTGGKDSRLIAAALVTAGVPVVARTHGFADHPDVVVAAEIAQRLRIEHLVRTPAAPGQEVDVLARIRATVLVADGMLSAFENVGRPDPAASTVITAGGHGGELLRGGYAETAAGKPRTGGGLRAAIGPARQAMRSAEMFRRLTAKHLGLLRRGPAASYVASLAPWSTALARGPLPALDDFYLVNRAGRWSAAARQAYLIRERLEQPLFDDRVVLAARAVPLADRVSGRLSAAVLAELCPALSDVPLAGKPASGQPAVGADGADGAAQPPFDWRRQYGEVISTFMRGYILDVGAAGGLFDVVSRPAAEKLLTPPHADRASVWALATLACLLSGDYRRAREPSPHLSVS